VAEPAPVSEIDPDKGAFVFATGKKGSGKSVLCRDLFDAFPYDRLVIDPTGDVTRDLRAAGVKVRQLADPLPGRWPASLDESEPYVTLTYVPNMSQAPAAAVDDMDRALGLALAHRRTLVWIDEIGLMTRAQSTPPQLQSALHQGRHRQLTLIMAGPRPINIDPLCIAQADLIAVFALPNPRDRRRVAEEMGWPPAEFDAAVHGLGRHEYLWYDATAWNAATDQSGMLWHMPPIPLRRSGRASDGPVTMA
jgi:nucleoside-triphosphatase THEP1